MNDLNLCLEVVNLSCQSRKPLEIDAWFQRTTNTKWCIGNQMVTLPMTSRDPERSSSWLQFQYASSAISRKQLEMLQSLFTR